MYLKTKNILITSIKNFEMIESKHFDKTKDFANIRNEFLKRFSENLLCAIKKKLESAIFIWWPPNFCEIIFRYLLNFLRGGLCISLPNSAKMDFLCVTTLFSNNFSTVIFKEARAKGVFQSHQFLVRRICSVHFLSTLWMWKWCLESLGMTYRITRCVEMILRQLRDIFVDF